MERWILLIFLILGGCKEREHASPVPVPTPMPSPSQNLDVVDQVQQGLVKAVDSSKDWLESVKKLDPEQAAAELKKLREVEYRVVSMPIDLTLLEQEAKLNDLGKDFWDCYHIEKKGSELLLYCKRNAVTPLRYLPSTLLGR